MREFFPKPKAVDKDIHAELTWFLPCVLCGETFSWRGDREIYGPGGVHKCDPVKLAGRMQMVWSGGRR